MILREIPDNRASHPTLVRLARKDRSDTEQSAYAR